MGSPNGALRTRVARLERELEGARRRLAEKHVEVARLQNAAPIHPKSDLSELSQAMTALFPRSAYLFMPPDHVLARDGLRFGEDEFYDMLHLFMCADPWPLLDRTQERMEALLDEESQSRGYENWIDAFHNHKGSPDSPAVDRWCKDCAQFDPEVGNDFPACTRANQHITWDDGACEHYVEKQATVRTVNTGPALCATCDWPGPPDHCGDGHTMPEVGKGCAHWKRSRKP